QCLAPLTLFPTSCPASRAHHALHSFPTRRSSDLPHLTARSAQRMDRDAQIRLRRLLLWRETTARSQDRPRSWILDNELTALLARSEEHTSELQSRENLVCRLLLEKKNKTQKSLAT